MFNSDKDKKNDKNKSLALDKNFPQTKEQNLEINDDEQNSTLNSSNHINESKIQKNKENSGIETLSNQCCPCCGDRLLNCIREKQTYLFCRRCWQEMPNINQC